MSTMQKRKMTVLAMVAVGLAAVGCGELTTEATPASQLTSAASGTDLGTGEGLTVMSRNLYLGANLDALLSAEDPTEAVGAAYAELLVSNAGDMGRALALAREIAANRPHLVGLQEVTRYVIAPVAGDAEVLDYVDVLLAYLGFLGADYTVAQRQANVTLTFPLVLHGQLVAFIEYQDGEAILARSDVTIEDATSGHYATQQTLSVGGQVFPNLRGWNAVTASAAGHRIRFVNTHLEIQAFRAVQEAQARELVERFADEPLPVVMVGDFNSAANHDAPEESRTDSYRTFREAGFADMWLREPHSVGGLTCCQNSTLTNPESELTQRLDLVLVRWGPASFGGQSWMDVLGEEPEDRIDLSGGPTLWPSDHAGVVARLWPAPGLVMP